ncbi:MAG: hypothetical protein KC933_40745, partial [Myxococcales bacterium]|nr:hypothetical protein [Myxococcales bacterium]
YREALQIVPDLPYLTGADPLVVMPGDTLNLYGGNLQSVTQVALGGGVTVNSGITASPGALQLTVPAGVQPGPVTVTNPFGVATSAFRLGQIVVSPVTTLAFGMLPRPGFGVNGDEFYALLNTASGQGNQVIVASSSGPGSAPQVLRTVSLSPILGSASEYVENMVVAPSGQIAILQTNQAVNPGGRLLTVGLPAFNLIGVCLLARANNVYEPSVVFDGATTAAYAHQPTNTADATQDGVLRIDLSDGSCEELFVGPKQGPLAISAQLPQGRSLLLAHQSRGSAVMDVDPASPLYGTLTSPWVSWPNTSATMLRIFSGPGTELFYESSQGGLGRFDPQSGVAPVVIPSAASGSGVVPDGARRYFLVAVSTVGPVLVDATLTPPRAVRSGLSFFYPHRAAAKPGTHTFFSSTTNASGLLRVDIYP